MHSSRPLLGIALTAPVWCASAIQAPDERVAAASPVETAIPPLPAPTDTAARLENVDGGSGVAMPAALDDSIPLPIAPVVAAGDDGDRLVSPASGDPYFLSFAAGPYYPPAAERVDPLLSSSSPAGFADGRPRAETYAFAMFEKRVTPARMAALEAAGARVLGFHPHYCLKVALAPAAADGVAAVDGVRWLGRARPWQKVHPVLVQRLAVAQPDEVVDLYVDVFDSDLNAASVALGVAPAHVPGAAGIQDAAGAIAPSTWMSNGWQQRALEALGFQVTEYVDSIRTFRARAAAGRVEALVGLDFVQFVSADLPAELQHDESTPMCLTDSTRASYSGGTNAAVLAGQADSGYHYGHDDLTDPDLVGWNFTSDPDGPFADGDGHGTHVAGTILGKGNANASYKGNAPGLAWGATGRFFIARIFDDFGIFSGSSMASILGVFASSFTDPWGNVSPKPHVVNHSWGTSGTGYVGTEPDPRTIDDHIYTHGQLQVWASGNQGALGAGSLLEEATSKNAFVVGSVLDYRDATEGDPGSLRSSSSRGPCGDGRWKPNVTAPGRWIRSCQTGTDTGYFDNSGTSMAAPHVTGLVAELADHFDWLRYSSARVASLVMATAITKDDVSLTYPSDTHLDEFGTGRVNAYAAHWGTSQLGWTNWGYDQTSASWFYGDFTINAGCTRLVVCMTYHEPSASAGAGTALVNDIDLWIDRPGNGIDPGGNTGDYFVQQSTIDNTEIRVINSPETGTWRWKTWPDSMSGTAHVSVTVRTVYGDTTPDGTLSVSANDYFVQPNQNVVITATVTNPDYIANDVFLDSTSVGDTLQASTTTLYDGAVTNLLTNNSNSGRDVTLGDIVHGGSRSAQWTTRWASEGLKSFCVEARSDNWVDENQCAGTITVDGTQPGLVTNLTSSTHTANVWSANPNITYTWTAAPDNLSGIDGYGIFTSTGTGAPSTVKDIEEVTAYSESLSSGSWYFNIRSVDNCGNWDADHASAGPYRIDTVAPSGPSGLTSPTHLVGVQSCSTTVTVNWTAASDAHSGLAGYRGVWDTSSSTVPSGALNYAAGATGATVNIGSSTIARYFHLRARDNVGNWGTTQHFGPIYANANSVSTYCTGKVNSLGCTPAIGWMNQPSKSAGNFTVTCSNVINNRFGLVFWGYTSAALPFQGGWKCIADPVVRTPIQDSGGTPPGVDDCSGTWSFVFDTAYMNAYGIDPGDTLFAQCWGRDPAVPSTTSLSNALRFTVCQ